VWLSSAARPLVWFLTGSSNVVLKMFGDSTTFSESRLSPNELRELVDEAADVGTLDPRVGDIASRAFDFAELTAFDVMVPRTQVVGIPRGATQDEIREIVLETAHSRLPVYEDDVDNVVGYVFYKDLLPLAWEGQLLVLEDLVRPPFYVVESMPAVELLHQMRDKRIHLAFVVDEQGGVGGIVTLDDLVEELVGEVFGEMHAGSPSTIRPQADGSLVVMAEATIRDLNRELDLALPDGPNWSTIGGLCMSMAGGVPNVGDVLRVEDGPELRIEEASDRAVLRVRIVPRPPA
jgi:putative hemolysin